MQRSKLSCTWPFQALADSNRFRVVRLLATVDTPLAAGQLAAALACAPSHISKHLEVLESAGLTQTVRKGRFRLVSLSEGATTGLVAAVVLSMTDQGDVMAEDLARLLAAPQPEILQRITRS